MVTPTEAATATVRAATASPLRLRPETRPAQAAGQSAEQGRDGAGQEQGQGGHREGEAEDHEEQGGEGDDQAAAGGPEQGSTQGPVTTGQASIGVLLDESAVLACLA